MFFDTWLRRDAKAATIYYLGRAYPLRVTHAAARHSACRIDADAIHINIPQPMRGRALKDEIATTLQLWYRKQARQDFRERMAVWGRKLGVEPNRLIVTGPLRRWGSCNYRNDIRLNWRLIRLPEALIDYVVAHELAHIRHKNHAPEFWRFLAGAMPDWKTRRASLRQWERLSG